MISNISSKLKSTSRTIGFFLKEFGEVFKGPKQPSLEEVSFATFLQNLQQKFPPDDKSSEILCIPLMDDVGMMKMIIEFGYRIASENKLAVKYFYVHTTIDHEIQDTGILKQWRFWKTSYLSGEKRLCSVYNINRKDVIATNYLKPNAKIDDRHHLSSKMELVSYSTGGITTGDLIYDTYLRFRNKAKVDLKDRSLDDIVNYSYQMIDEWQRVFSKYNVTRLLLPYAAYLHWGIPARIALSRNIQTTVFGSYTYILSDLQPSYPFHSKDHSLYRTIFKKLNNKQEKRDQSRIALEKRVGGAIDPGLVYMKSSAFHSEDNEAFTPSVGRKFAIVFLHCFFDSPHIYNGALFADFYEWIKFILNEAVKNPGINYYIKSHPNGLPGNEAIISSLINEYQSYDNITFISSRISNRQIIDAKPDAVFTLYGTVAHEFAYCGFPVITAGDNPHSHYNFLYNPTSVGELAYFIKNVGEYKLPEKYDVNEILEFYYMHYQYISPKYDQSSLTFTKNFNSGQVSFSKDVTTRDMIYYPGDIFNNIK